MLNLFVKLFLNITSDFRILWYNMFIVLGGEIAVPCNLQSAIVGLMSILGLDW